MSKGFYSCLAGFGEDLKRKVAQLGTLTSDMEAMQVGLKNDEPYSRSTVEPMTRLRKCKKDLEVARDNPDKQFVRDRIFDITGI